MEWVKALIKAGAILDIQQHQGQTPLIIATYFARAEILAELIAAGAALNFRDNYLRKTAIEYASNQDLTIQNARINDISNRSRQKDVIEHDLVAVEQLLLKAEALDALFQNQSAITNFFNTIDFSKFSNSVDKQCIYAKCLAQRVLNKLLPESKHDLSELSNIQAVKNYLSQSLQPAPPVSLPGNSLNCK